MWLISTYGECWRYKQPTRWTKRYVQNHGIDDDSDPASQKYAPQSSDAAKVQSLLLYLICAQSPISSQNAYGLLPRYKHKRHLPKSVSNDNNYCTHCA